MKLRYIEIPKLPILNFMRNILWQSSQLLRRFCWMSYHGKLSEYVAVSTFFLGLLMSNLSRNREKKQLVEGGVLPRVIGNNSNEKINEHDEIKFEIKIFSLVSATKRIWANIISSYFRLRFFSSLWSKTFHYVSDSNGKLATRTQSVASNDSGHYSGNELDNNKTHTPVKYRKNVRMSKVSIELL